MNVGAKKMIQESVIEESTKMMQAVNLLIVKHGKNWNLIYRQVILSYLRMYAVFTRERDNGYKRYMELLNKGIEMVFIDNPTLNTEYIKSMQNSADKMKKRKSYRGNDIRICD